MYLLISSENFNNPELFFRMTTQYIDCYQLKAFIHDLIPTDVIYYIAPEIDYSTYITDEGIPIKIPTAPNGVNITINHQSYGEERYLIRPTNSCGYLINMGKGELGFKPWEYALEIIRAYMAYIGMYEIYKEFVNNDNNPNVTFISANSNVVSYKTFKFLFDKLFSSSYDPDNIIGETQFNWFIPIYSITEYATAYTFLKAYRIY